MYTTEGIVLRKREVGEADTLFVLYTRDRGKIQALARGIRKEEAKLKGHLEPYSFSTIRCVAGRGGDKLIAASLIRFWENLRSRETTLRLAAIVADALDTHCFEGERDHGLWQLAYESFTLLDQEAFEEETPVPFLSVFNTRLRVCLGYGEDKHGEREALMAKWARVEYH